MTATATSSGAIRFTLEDAQRASDEWRFNCGPGALCAVLGMTPAELRPHLRDFEAKGYTNPTLMADILRGIGVKFRVRYQGINPPTAPAHLWPDFGLVRVQWDGPWTKRGVPMAARYRHTHWVAHRSIDRHIFDVNAICSGGWIPFAEWSERLVPWLLPQVDPRTTGDWWMTHSWDLQW